MHNSTIKLIALDLDGTLLRTDKTISERNNRAVRTAADSGIRVVLASGRMHSATVKYAHMLDMSPGTFVISYNGAMVRTVAGDLLFERPLQVDAADYLVNYCRANGLHLNYYLNDVLYNSKHDRWTDLYRSRTGSVAEIVGDLRQFQGKCPTKLIIVDHEEVLDKLRQPMQVHFAGQVTVMKTDNEYLEFMDSSANKGAALNAVASELGIAQNEVAAFGDNYNDMSMLEWAGHPYAMANGRAEILAQFPTHAPPADDDGVAQILGNILSGTNALY